MSIQDKWLEQFKAAVSHEVARANGKEADGYRAVAAKTHLGYDYIYQIYKGKPLNKPKMPGSEAMDAINREYGEVIGISKSNQALAPVDIAQTAIKDIATLEQSLEGLAVYLAALDAGDRAEAMKMISVLAESPDRHAKTASGIRGMVGAAFPQLDKKAA